MMLTPLVLGVLLAATPAEPSTTATIRDAIERNDLEGAAASLEAMLKADPKDLEALVALALLEMERERYREAAELFEKVLELDPWDDDSRLNLVEALWRAGSTERATSTVKTLLERHPELEEGLSYQADLAAGKAAPSRPSPWRKLLRLSLDVGFDSNYGYDSNYDGETELSPSSDLLGIDTVFGKKSAVGTIEALAGVNHLGRTRPITAYARIKTQQSIGQFDAFKDLMPTLVGLQLIGRKPVGTIHTELHLSYNELFTGLFDTHYHRLVSGVTTAQTRLGRHNRIRLATGVDYRAPEERTSDTTLRVSLRDTHQVDKFTISGQAGFRANYATVSPEEIVVANHNIDFTEYSGAVFLSYRFTQGLSAFALADLAKREFDVRPGGSTSPDRIADTTLFAQSGLVVEWDKVELHGEYAFSKNTSSFDERDYNRHQLNVGVRYWWD